MSDTNSDIDDTMAEADGDTAEQADSGAEEASELSIDEILGQADGEVAEVSAGDVVGSLPSEVEERAVKEVDVEISVVLGRSSMPIHQLLKMGRGAVIELDATTECDAWVYANNKLIARGEVMVVGENLGVSITENVTSSGD